jgi:tRNA(Arg) A34 adenosine deaminase TadA
MNVELSLDGDGRTTPSQDQVLEMLERAQDVAHDAMDKGHHPFGAVLFAADHETVLLEQGNLSALDHAEAVLARAAAGRWPAELLWHCTLVTTVEPCAMCAATQYWANIGRVVFALAEVDLLAGSPERAALDLPCREVFARGQKPIQVLGPVPGSADAVLALHQEFWSAH